MTNDKANDTANDTPKDSERLSSAYHARNSADDERQKPQDNKERDLCGL